jgi:polysaccharide chain length determinant protein (PEP-CTERM system associated)
MPQATPQKEQPPKSLSHWLGVIRRRHLYFLIPMFIGWLLVYSASWVIPARYKSSTLILVEQPTMPRDYVTPNVNEDLQERLQSITQQILSRSRLLHIMDDMHLYAKKRNRLSPDEAVEAMRKDIDIELVRGPDNRINAFKVSYSAPNPSTAQQVTSALTTLFISENLEVRQQASEDTTKFLETQLETARQGLTSQEDKIRAFKGQHLGELPAQLESNLQILSGLQSQLQAQEDALNTAKQQRVYVQTLLNQYRTAQGTTRAPDGARTTLSSVDEELDKLKGELNTLRSSYNDQYPEIRELKDKIARTEKLKQQLELNQGKVSASGQATSNSGDSASDGSGSRDLSATAQLQSQLRANEIEVKNREQSVESLKGEIDRYRGRLNQEPMREQELADLTRGYEQSKSSYDELVKKKNDSAMATSMELMQQGERFKVLDPASLPLKPSFPDRMKMCLMGLGIGIVLGLAAVMAMETMDDRIYDEAELKQLLPIPVISEIPVVSQDADARAEQKRLRLGFVIASVAFTIILAGSAFTYWRG